MNKKTIWFLIVLVVCSIIYRVLPNRIENFNPLYTISLFSGFIYSNNKKFAFLAPLAALFLSDIVYQVLYINGLGTIQGFYGWGQILQYASMLLVAAVGFFIPKSNVASATIGGVVGASVFFIFSNFFVWAEGMGFNHSFTFNGLAKCYADGIPFFKATLLSSVIFSVLVFMVYNLFFEKNTVVETFQ
jgi:hypothetical protein